MSLFPKDDLLAREIEAWRGFCDTLRKEDREMFEGMLRKCYRYTRAIQARGERYSTESLMMSLILVQHQMIDVLLKKRK